MNEDKIVSNDITIYVFLLKSCLYSVNYESNVHEQLSNELQTIGISIVKIYSCDDPNNLFEKYNIQYVPLCVIVYNGDLNNFKVLSGEINFENIKKTLDK